jgi:excisionase family DNA binding protein
MTDRAELRPLTVTVAQTRALLGVGHTTVYELLKHGRLKSITLGRSRRILFNSIERLIAEAEAA